MGPLCLITHNSFGMLLYLAELIFICFGKIDPVTSIVSYSRLIFIILEFILYTENFC